MPHELLQKSDRSELFPVFSMFGMIYECLCLKHEFFLIAQLTVHRVHRDESIRKYSIGAARGDRGDISPPFLGPVFGPRL